MKIYLAGAIQGAKDGGQQWRNEITVSLEELGFCVYNPLKDTTNLFAEIARLNSENQIDEIRSLSWIRDLDLELIDKSDIIVCYLDMDERPVGTFEEIFRAHSAGKPVLLWTKQPLNQLSSWLLWTFPPQYFFHCKEDLLNFIKKVFV